MKTLKLLSAFLIVSLSVAISPKAYAQGATCPGTPFCTSVGTPFTFPNTHNGTTGTGATSWGCLGAEPDPSWFYIKTTAAGAMNFTISQGTTIGGSDLDVDFIAYGPFTNAQFPNACNLLSGSCSGDHSCAGNIADCSFSAAGIESMTLNSPGAGYYYIIMITNYTGYTYPPGTAGFITFTEDSGPGTDCSITCNPTVLTLAGQDAATGTNVASGSTIPCGSTFWVYPNMPAFTDPTTDLWAPCVMADFELFNTNENTNGEMILTEPGGSPFGTTIYDLCNGCGQGTIGNSVGTTGTGLNEYLSWLDPTQAQVVSFCAYGTVGPTMVSLKNCWDGTVYAGPTSWNTSAGCFTLTVPAGTNIGSAAYSINPAGGGTGVYDYHDGYAYVDPSLIAAGTYTLTYTFNGKPGCAPGIGTYVFTVPTKPTITITPTAVTICNGASTNLTAGNAGGASTYTWNTGSTANPYNVSPGTTTVYTVTGTQNSTGCENTATATVTVTYPPATPGAPSGTTTMCSGSTQAYTTTGSAGATSYNWTVPAGTTINSGQGTTSINVTIGSTSGNICVDASNACGTSAYACTAITINAPSAAPTSASASPNPICPSSPTTLSVSGGSLGTGASWNWYSGSCGGTFVGTGASIVVSPAVATTYYIAAVGTCNTTACANITVNVNTTSTGPVSASASTNPVCPSSPTTLSVSGGSLGTGASWNWYSGSCGGALVGTGASIVV
ncbi:MAG TPA: hypothetical protein VF411_09500, partial [Bacteroidia bacterium]